MWFFWLVGLGFLKLFFLLADIDFQGLIFPRFLAVPAVTKKNKNEDLQSALCGIPFSTNKGIQS